MRVTSGERDLFTGDGEQGGPVAQFNLDGEVYYVFVSKGMFEKQAGFQQDGKADGAPEPVGEMVIAGRYFIITGQMGKNETAQNRNNKALTDILSAREFQIVALVAEGRVNKQIACQLKISEWTVSTYLRRIFAKLGVDSRAAMVYRCSEIIGKKDNNSEFHLHPGSLKVPHGDKLRGIPRLRQG